MFFVYILLTIYHSLMGPQQQPLIFQMPLKNITAINVWEPGQLIAGNIQGKIMKMDADSRQYVVKQKHHNKIINIQAYVNNLSQKRLIEYVSVDEKGGVNIWDESLNHIFKLELNTKIINTAIKHSFDKQNDVLFSINTQKSIVQISLTQRKQIRKIQFSDANLEILSVLYMENKLFYSTNSNRLQIVQGNQSSQILTLSTTWSGNVDLMINKELCTQPQAHHQMFHTQNGIGIMQKSYLFSFDSYGKSQFKSYISNGKVTSLTACESMPNLHKKKIRYENLQEQIEISQESTFSQSKTDIFDDFDDIWQQEWDQIFGEDIFVVGLSSNTLQIRSLYNIYSIINFQDHIQQVTCSRNDVYVVDKQGDLHEIHLNQYHHVVGMQMSGIASIMFAIAAVVSLIYYFQKKQVQKRPKNSQTIYEDIQMQELASQNRFKAIKGQGLQEKLIKAQQRIS